jgi:hypothetical protein
MTVRRLTKEDLRAPRGGSPLERAIHRKLAKARRVEEREARAERRRYCRGCSRLKTECNCPKSCLEASRIYNKIIEGIKAEGRRATREERIKRKRARFKVV